MPVEEPRHEPRNIEEAARAERPLKILFFSHYFPPEGNAPANRTYHHCKVWAEMGHEITVITCAPNCPDGVVYEGYENRWVQREVLDGIKVVRVWTYIAANKGFVRRVLNYLSYMFSALWRAVRLREEPDVIIATSPHFFCGWAGACAKWLLRRPFVLEVRDLWPESIVAVGALRKGIIYRVLEVLERRLYGSASQIVTVGSGYRDKLVARGVPGHRISIVVNGVESSLIRRAEADGNVALPNSDGAPFVVTYAGTVGLAAGLDVVLRAARLYQARNEEGVRFVIVGSGAELQSLQQAARAQGLHQVEFTGRLPREAAMDALRRSHCALVHLKDLELFRSVIPSKIAEAGALGVPLILGVRGEAARLVKTIGNGLIVEPDDERALVSAIDNLRNDPDLLRDFSRRGLDYTAEFFDRRVLARDLLRVLALAAGRVVPGKDES